MAKPNAMNFSEVQRKLQNLQFQANSVLSRQIPCDSVFRRLFLRLSGSFSTTYSSGTPVADIDVFDSLVPQIQVVVDGQDTIKSVRPYLMSRMQFLAQGVLGERKASAGASVAAGNNPTADAAMVFGTTTQSTTVAETIQIYFEDIMGNGESRHKTYLNLKGRSTCELRLTTGAFSSLQNISDTTAITYAASTLVFDIYTLEAPFVPAEQREFHLRQTTKEITFGAQTSDQAIDINKGAWLRGLAFLVRDGDSTKSLSNNALTAIKLYKNGQYVLKATDFQAVQAGNRAQRGLSAAYASNKSIIDGFAYMDMLTDNDWRSAVDTRRESGVDNMQVFLTTAAAGSGATYSSYPVSVTVQTDEYVPQR